MVNRQFADFQKQIEEAVTKGEEYKYAPPADDRYTQLLAEVNRSQKPESISFSEDFNKDFK